MIFCCFSMNPITTIPNLLKNFALFKTLLNLQINFSKFKALNISLPRDILLLCQKNFPFGWESHAITYLGVQLPIKLNEIYSRNFTPILKGIQQDLQKWTTGSFLWFGRAAIVKMKVLPRIVYLLQTYSSRFQRLSLPCTNRFVPNSFGMTSTHE